MFTKIIMISLFPAISQAGNIKTIAETRNEYVAKEIVLCQYLKPSECELEGYLGEDLTQTKIINNLLVSLNLKKEIKSSSQELEKMTERSGKYILFFGSFRNSSRVCLAHRVNCRYLESSVTYNDLLNFLSVPTVVRYQKERLEQEKILQNSKNSLKIDAFLNMTSSMSEQLSQVFKEPMSPLGNNWLLTSLTRNQILEQQLLKTYPEDELVECIKPKKISECDTTNPLDMGHQNYMFDVYQMLPYGFDMEKRTKCSSRIFENVWDQLSFENLNLENIEDTKQERCIASKINCKSENKPLSRARFIESSWSSKHIAEYELGREYQKKFLSNPRQELEWVDKGSSVFVNLEKSICNQKKEIND